MSQNIHQVVISVLCLAHQSCLTLCDPMDCSPPGSSVHGILQARILEWLAMPSSRGSSRPSNWTGVSFASEFFTSWATREAHFSGYWNKIGMDIVSKRYNLGSLTYSVRTIEWEKQVGPPWMFSPSTRRPTTISHSREDGKDQCHPK